MNSTYPLPRLPHVSPKAYLFLFRTLNVIMMLLLIGPWLAPIMLRASTDGTTPLHWMMGTIASMVYAIGNWVCPEQNVSWSVLGYRFTVCVRCFSAGIGLVSASGLYAIQYRWGNRLKAPVYRRISLLLLLLFVAPWIIDSTLQLTGIWSGTIELRTLTAWTGGLGLGLYAYGLLFNEPSRLKRLLASR